MTQAARGADLLAAAERCVASGRRVAGQALLAAARASGAPDEPVAELHGRLLLDAGRPLEAIPLLAGAVASAPGNWRLRSLAAEALLLGLDAASAAAQAAEAVVLAPREVAPKAILGSALLALGRVADARACLAEALVANPAHVGYRLALSNALATDGQPDMALALLAEGIELRPQALDLRVAALRLAIGIRDFPAALQMADAACEHGTFDAVVLGLRGHALSSLGRDEDALIAYADALRLAPEDAYVRHLVAAGGQAAAPSRADPDYVRVVFDGFAPHFEDDLIQLQYRVPALIRQALLAHLVLPAPPRRLGPVLDIGCGTGWVALVLSDLALGPFTGIDISPRMLAEASAKGLYERLVEDDVLSGLDALGAFAVVVAADVMPYLGDPAPVFAAVGRTLLPGGLFVLTAEVLPDDAPAAFRLGERARFAHRPAALREAAHASGLGVLACTDEVLRVDRGSPVAGCVLVLQQRSPQP